jgi:hypothetical protein
MAIRLDTLAIVPVKRVWIAVIPESNGELPCACAASGITSKASNRKPEIESLGRGFLTRAALEFFFMFAPPSDSTPSGMAQTYGHGAGLVQCQIDYCLFQKRIGWMDSGLFHG